uniref:Uncharacterized protein LOC100179293 n=1 Tax=Phallusia mammillata TaxID=59560 RepID=A0A6F9DHI8_9ASCI|nr:uncharacterized protein LOC100179293 [Phallusia mammillata]
MELDLIPTKISSIQQDPLLLVTPEKPPSILNAKRRLQEDNLQTIAENEPFISISKIPSNTDQYHFDPELLVTPEKPPSALKKNLQSAAENAKGPIKNKVRFDVPESSEETSNGSITNSNTVTDYSSTSTEYDQSSSATLTDDNDFSMRAALYTQRNPLADITTGSNQTMDSSSTLESSSSQSTFSVPSFEVQQLHSTKVVDLRNKITNEQQKPSDIINVRAQKSLPIFKTKLPACDKNHRKFTPVQTKIDELTATKDIANDIKPKKESPKGEKVASKQSYLKKKSGLARHGHSVKYVDPGDETKTNALNTPKYNTSLAIGQGLQKIKENKFNAVTAVKKKINEDDELRAHVATKSATGTNIDPEERLFSNLISLDIPLSDSTGSAEFRRIKRQIHKVCAPMFDQVFSFVVNTNNFLSQPSSGHSEPNIFSLFPNNLTQEKLVLDSKCYCPPDIKPENIPVEAVMSLYNYSLCWDMLNST